MKTVNQKSGISLLFIIWLQLATYIVIFFDVPVARQVILFLYLTFVPGFVIVKILRLDNLDGLETVLFSVGLSIAFLMLGGFLVNDFLFLFGISHPLSLLPLLIIINSIILVGAIVVYLRGDSYKLWSYVSIKGFPFALLFMVLPVLSIIGALYVNVYENNLLLLFTIIAISLLFIVGVLSKKLLPSNWYPFALLMIAIAILFHSSLISNYIVPYGSDASTEAFLFKTTESNLHWSSNLPSPLNVGSTGKYNAMLSVTILPTIYSVLLKIDSTWIFKLLFPLIFAFIPLGLYQLWQKLLSKKYAFISAFLFMAQATFYTEMLGLARQMIAELFFVLLLLLIMKKEMTPFTKTVCFMIFSFALVTSHYAVAAIFMLFISFTLILLIILKRPNKNITIPITILFFVLMLIWYVYISGSATFTSFLESGNYVYAQLSDFFNPASRGQMVLTGLGLVESPSIWNTIGRIFAYFTQAFIVFGFIGLVTKRASVRIQKEYYFFSSIAMAFLAMLLLVPGLANTLNMTRFYHLLLFFLAPFCVIGVMFIVKLLSKREKEFAALALLLVVLVPYFLFQTSFVYEVTGSDSWSIPLSGYRMNALRFYGSGYANEHSVYSAQWLSKNIVVENSNLYADDASHYVLPIYGMIPTVYVNRLSNVTTITSDGFVYLSPLNVVEGKIVFGQLSWNSSELSFIFDDLNIIYANGGSEIYSAPER